MSRPGLTPQRAIEAPEAASWVAPALLAWYGGHGRRHLPWQQARTPYRVWVSEVMLQQTQVETVIPYYQRFTARFPDIAALAGAPLDEVLHHWTGLGYYARARNLHAAARTIMTTYGGRFPADIAAVQALPGIGRSTAGAILALSMSQRHPILDGNARRVLARCFGVEGHASRPEVARRLWALADACTPHERVADYTQAIMDLGATLCTRARPACEACPLLSHCVAHATGRQSALPSPRPRRTRPHRDAYAIIVMSNDGVLLTRRPETGLWAGLWSFPLFETEEALHVWLAGRFGVSLRLQALPAYDHAFTHFELTLYPHIARLEVTGTALLPDPDIQRWCNPASPGKIGLTKPVTDLLKKLTAS